MAGLGWKKDEFYSSSHIMTPNHDAGMDEHPKHDVGKESSKNEYLYYCLTHIIILGTNYY